MKERRMRKPRNPNLFHGEEYPLTFWFYADAFDRPLKDGEEIGQDKVNEIVQLQNGVINVAILYWMIDVDGQGSVHCRG